MTAQPDDHTQASRDPNPVPQAGCVKEGWRLVPIEPTREQYLAFKKGFEECPDGQGYFNAFDAGYTAAVLASPPPPVAESGWQPIETAPKDGTRIVGYSREAPGSKIRTTWWRDPKKDDCGYTGWGEFNMTHWPPSHWMPLPAPPALVAEKQTP